MNETRARETTLLQAFETAQPPSPSWTDDDRAWASRVAKHDAAVGADADANANAETYIARRAHHAMQRLAPREPAAATWLQRRLWHSSWVAAVKIAAFIVGLLADSIGSSQRVNLLAPPLWGVVAWNLVVYALLLGAGLATLMRRSPPSPGPINRWVQRTLRWGRGLPGVDSLGAAAGGSAAALRSFAALWSRRSAALSGARAATVLHAAAAALALGLIAGLYARGLVLDYRAAWESTFVSAATAHAALTFMLAPAVALSGIALPDEAAFAALRVAHGGVAEGVSAAPWIHLYAITLGLIVVLPRTLLGLWSFTRNVMLSRRFGLPLAEPYFQRLLREQRGEIAHVQVLPYACTPTPQAVLGLRALLARVFGETLQLQIAPTVAFGAEDDAELAVGAEVTVVLALFDLSATPEAENHGRYLQRLAEAAPPGAVLVMLVDGSAFRERFAATPQRFAERIDAWRAFARGHARALACVEFASGDVAIGERELRAALGLS